MKFTSKDLMKAMGLNVGDKIKATFETHSCIDNRIYTEERIVNIVTDNNFGVALEHDGVVVPIEKLVNKDFEILPKPKRVGDLKCKGKCAECPLKTTRCEYKKDGNETLYDILDCMFDGIEDEEIYDLLKARLDKEVVEE